MPSDNLPTAAEILSRFYDAERIYMSAPPNEADFSGIAATMAPSVKLYQSPDLPYGGEYEGPEGREEYFYVFLACMSCIA